MTLTREALAERARRRRKEARKSVPFVERRNAELLLLILGGLAIATGLWLVYKAKAAPAEQAVNLNALSGAPQILTLFQGIPASEYIADRIDEMHRRGFHFENDGALPRLRIKETDLRRPPRAGTDDSAAHVAAVCSAQAVDHRQKPTRFPIAISRLDRTILGELSGGA